MIWGVFTTPIFGSTPILGGLYYPPRNRMVPHILEDFFPHEMVGAGQASKKEVDPKDPRLDPPMQGLEAVFRRGVYIGSQNRH